MPHEYIDKQTFQSGNRVRLSFIKKKHLVSGINPEMKGRKKYPLHQKITQVAICLDLVNRNLPKKSCYI